MEPIRAVCFDLGGVVVRISYHWAEMLVRCGLSVPSHITPDQPLSAMPELEAYQAGDLTDDEYFVHLAHYLGDISIDDAKRVHLSMLIEPFPGILEIVEDLNTRGIVTGCLSNTNAPHWKELAYGGRFPAILAMKIKLASHEIDVAKPDAKAFNIFAEATGVPPEGILLFDDSAVNCEAARKLGWQAKHIDPSADPASQMRACL